MKFIYIRLLLALFFIFNFTGKSFSQVPVAIFTVSDQDGCAPFIGATFDASGSTNNPTSYTWDFGDGTGPFPTLNAVVQHNYAIPGFYTISLIATNGSGSSTPLIQTNLITVYQNPTANFVSDVDTACSGQLITFTDTSLPGDGLINFYSWSFQDGSPIDSTSGATVTHTYNNFTPNYISFNPQFTVRDVNGCMSTFNNVFIYIIPFDSACIINGLNDLSSVPFSAYPNPGTSSFTIENIMGITINQISIYNSAGIKLKEIFYKGGESKIIIQTEEFFPGIYFIECVGISGIKRIKILKL